MTWVNILSILVMVTKIGSDQEFMLEKCSSKEEICAASRQNYFRS